MMVSLGALLVPILVSAVGVFMMSSVIHMALKYHNHDYDKLPDENAFVDSLKAQKVGPGNYVFPCALTAEERKQPEVMEQMKNGPAGFLTVAAGFNMGKSMVSWFVLCLVITTLVAYLASQVLVAGATFSAVFRFTMVAALLGFAGCAGTESVWMGRRWNTTFRHIFDGLLFSLVTGAVFGWLWP